MRRVLTLTRKELFQLFVSPIAYAYGIVFVFFVTFMFFRFFFLIRQTTMSEFFNWVPLSFAVIVPGVTMRSWAEERKQGTIEFLLTSPIDTWQIVVAKFLAALALVGLCLTMTLLVPYTVSRFGDLDAGPVWGGYVGSLLCAATLIAIGMFLSSFTQDQIVSFLVSVIVLLSLVLLGHYWFSTEYRAGSAFGAFAQAVSPSTHFESIGRGVVDIRNVYYFGALTGLFLYLNTRVIDLRRWR